MKQEFTTRQIDVDEVAEIAAERVRHQHTTANRWTVLGNVDGKVTTGDVGVSVLIVVATFVVGVIAAGVDVATGSPWAEAKSYVRDLTRLGIVFGVGYLAVEIFDLQGWAVVLLDGFWELIRERNTRPKEEPDVVLSWSVQTSETGFQFLEWKGDDAVRAIAFARRYLEIESSAAVDYPLAEKHYVGSGLVWSRGATDYGNWQAFKAQLLASGLAVQNGARWELTKAGVAQMRRLDREAREAGL